MTYIVGASIRLHSLQVVLDQWRRFRTFPKSRSRYWKTFSRQPQSACCIRLGDIATCSRVVLWARHVQTSLREAERLHTSSRLKCHLFEGRSLGATRANPAFGKPITFTDSQGNIAIRLSAVLWARDVQTQPSGSRTPHSPFLTTTAASVRRLPIQQRYLYSASNFTSHVTTTAASLQLSSDRRPYWLQRFRQRTQCH